MTDLSLIVEDRTFVVHRSVLFARCPKFYQSHVKSHTEVKLEGVKSSVFPLLLEFLYTDRVGVSKDIASELEKIAKLFELPRLEAICKQKSSFVKKIPPPSFSNDMIRLLESGELADIEFRVEGKTIKAHKVITSFNSSKGYFGCSVRILSCLVD